jgi:hypothetical protein
VSKTHRIYFLKRADGLIKIGTTTDFEVRAAALAVGHGPLEVIRVVNGGPRRERALHTAFKRFWEYGEWFRSERGALEGIIGDLEDGEVVPVDVTEASNEWEAGEANFMATVRERAQELVKLRSDRDLSKTEAAIDALNADHGLSKYFLRHILNGKARTVSAYGYERLMQARRVEMHALLEHLQGEIRALLPTEDDEVLDIGRRLMAIEEALKERRRILAEIQERKAGLK